MNISRIILFAVVLLVLRVGVSIMAGGPEPGEELTGRVVFGFLLKRYLPDALVVIAVLMSLARVQIRLPYVHALAVVVLQELLSAVLLFATGWNAPSSPFWLLDYVVLIVSAAAGTAVGIRLRAIAEKKAGTG